MPGICSSSRDAAETAGTRDGGAVYQAWLESALSRCEGDREMPDIDDIEFPGPSSCRSSSVTASP